MSFKMMELKINFWYVMRHLKNNEIYYNWNDLNIKLYIVYHEQICQIAKWVYHTNGICKICIVTNHYENES